MDEYIKRGEALEIICSECVRDSFSSRFCGVPCYEYEKMKILPAADVRENVRGEWIDFDDDYSVYDCSVCGERSPMDVKWNFCPNCGADMREEKKK